jgi:hypothetical protein
MHSISITYFEICFDVVHICHELGSRNSGMKREARCKSGTIPVAVSSANVHTSPLFLHGSGKAVNLE